MEHPIGKYYRVYPGSIDFPKYYETCSVQAFNYCLKKEITK
jgi:hypothetical protein